MGGDSRKRKGRGEKADAGKKNTGKQVTTGRATPGPGREEEAQATKADGEPTRLLDLWRVPRDCERRRGEAGCSWRVVTPTSSGTASASGFWKLSGPQLASGSNGLACALPSCFPKNCKKIY